MGSLADVLNDEPTDKPTPEPEGAVEAPEAAASEPKPERPISRRQAHRDREEAAKGRVRDPATGQYVAKPKDEPPPAEPKAEAKPEEPKAEAKPAEAKPEAKAETKQEMSARELAFLKAAQEERQKRQELERRLQEMSAAPKPGEPSKGFWDDPEGHLAKFREELQQTAQKTQVSTKLQTSEVIARRQYKDFDAKVAVFTELAQSVPGLVEQMVQAPDPAEFLYQTAKNHLAIREAGSVEEMVKKAQEEAYAKARAELEAEWKAKQEAAERARRELVPSLSDARGVTSHRPVWNGPTPLDNILK